LHSESDDHRNIVVGSMVRRLMGDEPASQMLSTTRGVDDPPIQRGVDSGVVPRFVDFLRRDDYPPDLQRGAVDALVSVALGAPGQARAVLDAGAIPQFVRLLRSSGYGGTDQAVQALGLIARANVDSRDFLLRDHAMPPLLELVGLRTTPPVVVRRAAGAISTLCCGDLPPPFRLVRPALSPLARLLRSSDPRVVEHACCSLSELTDGPNDDINIVSTGVCRRIVPLLRHPSSYVQQYVR
jgi:importin subunit alpha-6/7